MREAYDVVIVGAGPAGASLARELANHKAALKILLLDGSMNNREKVCGGLLAPDAQKYLAKKNLSLPKYVLADPQIFSVEVFDLGAQFEQAYQRAYVNMDREKFDQWLISLVPDTVEVIKARYTSVEAVSGNMYKISYNAEGDNNFVYTRFVVGADGAKSALRRKFFPKKQVKQYTAIQEWYSRSSLPNPAFHCIYDEQTSDSCSWLLFKDQYVIYGGAFPKRNAKERFMAQKERFSEYINSDFPEPIKYEACLVSSPRKFSDFFCGDQGIFFIGEAGSFISSSSFEGFSNAFLTAEALAKAFAKGALDPASILRKYKKNTLSLRIKLYLKTKKRYILCHPGLRAVIMKSGIMRLHMEDGVMRKKEVFN